MNPEQSFDAESVRAAEPMDQWLAARGVRMRFLGLPPADGDLGVPDLPTEETLTYREAAALPQKLIVIDRRIAFVPFDHRDLNQGYVEIAAPAIVEALVAEFERCWTTASDPWRTGVPSLALTMRERMLIGLLAAGHTDNSAARQLRISGRSVTNIVRRLMDRLGVNNRFQLGLALGAHRIAAVPAPRTSAPIDDEQTREELP